MSLSLVTEPTEEPVTVDEQKEHMRIDADDNHDDAFIYTCIVAARTWIEGQTRRCMKSQTWDYSIDCGWPRVGGMPRITLPLNPVKAIGDTSPEVFSITYVDTDGATQTLATSQYTLVSRRYGSYIVPSYNVTWPDVRNVPNAITVRFVAGESNVPEPLNMATMVLATHYYENRETAAKAPEAVESVVSAYRSPRL
jgi:uncharacterized phiE125 gp8 family phage protein